MIPRVERVRGGRCLIASYKYTANCIVALLLALSAIACFGTKSQRGAELPSSAVVRVENRDHQDVTIYWLRGSHAQRLGTVAGNTATVFEIPAIEIDVPGDIRLLADPLGSSRRLTSEPVPLRRGSRVDWVLDPGLRRGTLSVY